VPGINPEGLRGGTYSPEDAQVSTLLASESFYEEARKFGAVFHFNENFISFIKPEGRIIGIKTDKDEYFADDFLIASGADAEETCLKAGLTVPIKPDSHEAGITSAVKQFLAPLVVDMRPGEDGRTANFYFGQTHSGQIIFCYTPKPIIPGENRYSTSEFMPIIARRMVDLIPRFRNLLIRRIWRGLYPMTPDGVAVVGKHSAVNNVYLGVGMCGQGFMLGPGVGLNLAHLIVHGKPLLEPEVFNLLSPERNFYEGKEEKLK
jgi:sarcosine oxidase subunit beta